MDGLGAAATAAIALLTAGLFLGVARDMARRPVSPGSEAANRAFVIAWASMGSILVTDAVRHALAATAPESVWYVTMMQVKVLAMAIMLAAFGAYVLFLYRGSLRGIQWFGFAAALHGVYFLYGLRVRLPVEVVVGRWGGQASFVGDGGLWGGVAFGLATFFLPLLALVVAYALLWRRVPSNNRARLLAVIWCLGTFMVAGSVQANPAVSPDGPAFPVAGLALLLAAATAAFVFRGSDRPRPDAEPVA